LDRIQLVVGEVLPRFGNRGEPCGQALCQSHVAPPVFRVSGGCPATSPFREILGYPHRKPLRGQVFLEIALRQQPGGFVEPADLQGLVDLTEFPSPRLEHLEKTPG
jgi:hypothetical protein